MNQAVLDKISNLDWDSLGRRLKAVSVFWAKIYHGSKWKTLPKGYTHKDVVQESIRRAFSHEWETFDENRFEEFLMGSVRSVVSNLAKSARIQKTEPMDLFELEVQSNEDIEEQFERAEVIEKINNAMEEEEILKNVFDRMCDGNEPRDISKELQIPVKEVYNLKKRIVRIIEQISKEI